MFGINVSKEVIQANLQEMLKNLDIWCKYNGMDLKSSKTKVMLVTTLQKRSKLNDDTLSLLYKEVILQAISFDKILGVYVDNNLSWSFHVNFLTKKISSYLWLLSKIKGFLSIENRV